MSMSMHRRPRVKGGDFVPLSILAGPPPNTPRSSADCPRSRRPHELSVVRCQWSVVRIDATIGKVRADWPLALSPWRRRELRPFSLGWLYAGRSQFTDPTDCPDRGKQKIWERRDKLVKNAHNIRCWDNLWALSVVRGPWSVVRGQIQDATLPESRERTQLENRGRTKCTKTSRERTQSEKGGWTQCIEKSRERTQRPLRRSADGNLPAAE